MLAGMGTGNPALATAGATIMTTGFCHWKSDKLKDKVAHKEQTADGAAKTRKVDGDVYQVLNAKSRGRR